MLQKIISFIKYHNAVSIGASLILVLSFSAMASDDVRDIVLGEKIVKEQGVDNSVLLAADLANFDLEMKIIDVTEDNLNYYVDYQFETLGIQDDIWKPIMRQKQMVISKAALADRDLGLYVSEELGEIIDNEIAYLKEVQQNEEEKGQTFIQETTKYTGLIGLVLDTKTKELPGYEPVVKPPEIVPAPITEETAPIDEQVSDYIKPESESNPEPIPTPEFTPAPVPEPTPDLIVESAPIPEPTPDPASTPAPAPVESESLAPKDL